MILFPFFLILAGWIKWNSPGPIFFLQERVGKDGKSFKIIKFRTMQKNAPQMGPSITQNGDPRITRPGLFLRRYKLDELPQLINVLKGEMSLVGSRPEVPKFVDLNNRDWQTILGMSPGITGLSQLSNMDEEKMLAGRIDPEAYYISEILPKKMALDLEYVRNSCFLLDLQIIFRTLAGLKR